MKRSFATSGSDSRNGLKLLELFIIIVIIFVFILLLFPYVRGMREDDRLIRCRNNMKQFGLALQNFESAFAAFPHLDRDHYQSDGSYYSSTWAGIDLLPYLEQQILYEQTHVVPALLDMESASNGDFSNWFEVRADLAVTGVPVWRCPSTSQALTVQLPVYEINGVETQGEYGTATYAFSAGNYQSWCLNFSANDYEAGYRPAYSGRRAVTEKAEPSGFIAGAGPDTKEVGMFYRHGASRITDIIDGTSNTFAMGEAVGGVEWPLCRGVGCTQIQKQKADYGWLVGQAGDTLLFKDKQIMLSSGVASTFEPLNKYPVTDSYMAQSENLEERKTGVIQRNCNVELSDKHSIGNFSSPHGGQALFLMADGSVQIISQNINTDVYSALGSIAGQENFTFGETFGI